MKQHKIGEVKLTPEQRTIFASESGKLIHEAMTNIIGTESWNEQPDLQKKRIFEEVIELGHKQGKAMAITPEQREQEVGRIVGELRKRMEK